jgi:hypothetical protein
LSTDRLASVDYQADQWSLIEALLSVAQIILLLLTLQLLLLLLLRASAVALSFVCLPPDGAGRSDLVVVSQPSIIGLSSCQLTTVDRLDDGPDG